MANIKNYGITGVSADVQFGKGGGRLVWDGSDFLSTTDGSTLTGVKVATTPTHANHATSKSYVDNLVQGLDPKESVRAATTAAGTLATDFQNGSVVDGVTLATGDRILIKNQTNAVENGIYIVQASGAPVRASDADDPGDLSGGTFVFVEEGSTLADTGWVITSNGSLTPGTDAINWVQFSSAGIATAGVGLTKTGNVFDVNIGANTVTVDASDNLIVNSNAVTGQPLLSSGTVGVEAAYGQLDLSLSTSTVNLLRKDRGGLDTDISGFAANSLFVNAASGVNELAIGNNGNTLIVSAGAPAWGQLDLADNTNAVTGVLDETNGGTGNSTYTTGDILYATGANTLGKLALGTADQVIVSDGSTIAWQTVPTAPGSITTFVANVTSTDTTVNLGTLRSGATAVEVRVVVTTPWDDNTATLTVGTSGAPSELMVAGENDLANSGQYVAEVFKTYATGGTLQVSLSNGAATTGAATVMVKYIYA